MNGFNDRPTENMNVDRVAGYIMAGSPVLASGCRTKGFDFIFTIYGGCHEWVIDGVRTGIYRFTNNIDREVKYNIGYKCLSTGAISYFATSYRREIEPNSIIDLQYRELHHNWGWGWNAENYATYADRNKSEWVRESVFQPTPPDYRNYLYQFGFKAITYISKR